MCAALTSPHADTRLPVTSITPKDVGVFSFFSIRVLCRKRGFNQKAAFGKKPGGAGRNRTADEGFADPCLATWLPRLASFHLEDVLPYFRVQDDRPSNILHGSIFLLTLPL